MIKLSKIEQKALTTFFDTISQAANYAQAHFAKELGDLAQDDNEIAVSLLASNLKLYYVEHANKQLQAQNTLDLGCDYTDFFIKELLLSYRSGMRAVGCIIDSTGKLTVEVYRDQDLPDVNSNKGIVRIFFNELGMTAPLFIKTLEKVAGPDGYLPIDLINQAGKLKVTYARPLA